MDIHIIFTPDIAWLLPHVQKLLMIFFLALAFICKRVSQFYYSTTLIISGYIRFF